MRKPVVDYRRLRLSNLTSPAYRHLLWLAGWIGYLALYVLTENFIPARDCHVVHCFLDDVIPFREEFVIAYTGWYLLIVWSLVYFAAFNPKNFTNLQKYIIITQVVAMAAYILYPTRQELRPAEFPRNNVFTWILGLIYRVDTNTGVCPSLHVAYSLGIASTWLKERDAAWGTKVFVVVAVVLICMSVAFVKQHSVVDIVAALPLGLLAEILVFGRSYWKPKLAALKRK